MKNLKVVDLTGESKRWLVTLNGKEIGVIYYMPSIEKYSAEPDGGTVISNCNELQDAINYITKHGKYAV